MVRFVRPEGLTRWQWVQQRYHEGVNVRGPDDCWLWTKAKVTDGYGTIAQEAGIVWATHRLAWVLEHTYLPSNMEVLHSCDTPACCNPKHLFLGTKYDNMRDRITKGRNNEKLTRQLAEKISQDKRKQRVIAEEYGISQSMVSRIKRGNRWHEW